MANKKKLVLVVHGVGEQAAGDTLDSFVGAATNNVDGSTESELVYLREHHQNENPRALDTFPCHTRHVRENGSGDETLFSEVYWADLSQGPTGAFSTILEFIKTILGLGYLIRANVREVHENEEHWAEEVDLDAAAEDAQSLPTAAQFSQTMGKKDWRIRVADIFVWLAHGPNAVLNLLLAIGVLLTYVFFQFLPYDWVKTDNPYFPHAVFALISAFATGLGYLKRPTNRLFRQCSDWMFFIGVAMFVLLACGLVGHVTGLIASADIFDFYISIVVAVLQLTWLVMLLMAAVLVLFWVFNGVPNPKNKARMVYPQTIAAMVVFWLIVACIFWIALGAWAETNRDVKTLLDAHLKSALGLLTMAMASLALVIVTGVVEAMRRAKWIKAYPEAHITAQARADNPEIGQEGQPAVWPKRGKEVPRLLLNSVMGWVMSICLLAMAATAVLIALNRGCGAEPNPTPDAFSCFYPDSLAFWKGRFNEIAAVAAGGLGTIFVLAWPFLQKHLGVGLGVGKDVINYFVDSVPKKSPLQNFKDMMEDPDRATSFTLRHRINTRFRIVLDTKMQAFKPDEVLIISHSQGTMISVSQLSRKDVLQSLGKVPYTLITMGSPFSHLYHYYFPTQFNIDNVDPALLRNWVNIFRVDDFVGTYIKSRKLDPSDSEEFPKNIPIYPYGHTGYWFDQQVLDLMASEVGLRFKSARD
jgi:hypothetical protein